MEGCKKDCCKRGRNDHRRASGQTHMSGALPTVVLCQGTNVMRVRNNTSSVRSYIGEPRRQCRKIPKVAHSPQQKFWSQLFIHTSQHNH
jgi:hypothetical protein